MQSTTSNSSGPVVSGGKSSAPPKRTRKAQKGDELLSKEFKGNMNRFYKIRAAKFKEDHNVSKQFKLKQNVLSLWSSLFIHLAVDGIGLAIQKAENHNLMYYGYKNQTIDNKTLNAVLESAFLAGQNDSVGRMIIEDANLSGKSVELCSSEVYRASKESHRDFVALCIAASDEWNEQKTAAKQTSLDGASSTVSLPAGAGNKKKKPSKQTSSASKANLNIYLAKIVKILKTQLGPSYRLTRHTKVTYGATLEWMMTKIIDDCLKCAWYNNYETTEENPKSNKTLRIDTSVILSAVKCCKDIHPMIYTFLKSFLLPLEAQKMRTKKRVNSGEKGEGEGVLAGAHEEEEDDDEDDDEDDEDDEDEENEDDEDEEEEEAEETPAVAEKKVEKSKKDTSVPVTSNTKKRKRSGDEKVDQVEEDDSRPNSNLVFSSGKTNLFHKSGNKKKVVA